MNKIIIGVIPLWDEHKHSFWMLPGYMEGMIQAGGIPVMLPLTTDKAMIVQMADRFDGFLFTGGHDISPELYQEKKSCQCGYIVKQRDTMEALLFRKLLKSDKPCLGICRGIQLFNAMLGGSLYQDLPSELPQSGNHRQAPPYDKPTHSVTVLADTPLRELLQTGMLEVNSYHHQAIKELSPKLSAMAISEDNLIEAVYLPEHKFIWAVQWHPEYSLQDPNSQKLFLAFADACRNGG